MREREGVMYGSGGRANHLRRRYVTQWPSGLSDALCGYASPPHTHLPITLCSHAWLPRKGEQGQQSGSLNYKTGQFLNDSTTVHYRN